MTEDLRREVLAAGLCLLYEAAELISAANPLPPSGQQAGAPPGVLGILRDAVRTVNGLRKALKLTPLTGLHARPWPPYGMPAMMRDKADEAVIVSDGERWTLMSIGDAAKLEDEPVLYIGPLELPEPIKPEVAP